MSNKTDQFEIEIILSYLSSNSKKIFNEIILAKKNKMWATIIVFSLTILDYIFHLLFRPRLNQNLLLMKNLFLLVEN